MDSITDKQNLINTYLQAYFNTKVSTKLLDRQIEKEGLKEILMRERLFECLRQELLVELKQNGCDSQSLYQRILLLMKWRETANSDQLSPISHREPA